MRDSPLLDISFLRDGLHYGPLDYICVAGIVISGKRCNEQIKSSTDEMQNGICQISLFQVFRSVLFICFRSSFPSVDSINSSIGSCLEDHAFPTDFWCLNLHITITPGFNILFFLIKQIRKLLKDEENSTTFEMFNSSYAFDKWNLGFSNLKESEQLKLEKN